MADITAIPLQAELRNKHSLFAQITFKHHRLSNFLEAKLSPDLGCKQWIINHAGEFIQCYG